jgi:hypothetical protein
MQKSTFRTLIVLISAALWSSITPGGSNAQELCKCGPDYCLKDPRFPALLNAKKKRLRAAGFGDDLIALLDQDGACVAAVEKAPDTFFIKRKISGGWDTRELNAERERYAREDIISGAADAYYKFNTNHAQDCCGQPKFDKRPDFDTNLDLNLGLAIVCRKSGSSVSCQKAK